MVPTYTAVGRRAGGGGGGDTYNTYELSHYAEVTQAAHGFATGVLLAFSISGSAASAPQFELADKDDPTKPATHVGIAVDANTIRYAAKAVTVDFNTPHGMPLDVPLQLGNAGAVVSDDTGTTELGRATGANTIEFFNWPASLAWVAAPATSASPGKPGQIAENGNQFFFFSSADDEWKAIDCYTFP